MNTFAPPRATTMPNFILKPVPDEAPEVVRVESLVKQFQGRKVLDGLTLTMRRGERVAIIGASGSGKTTALRCLAGLIKPDAGSIYIAESSTPDHKAPVGFVSQKLNDLWEHLTLIQNVRLALEVVRKLPRVEAHQRAERVLTRLGLSHRFNARPNHLSGGEYQRAKIARSLVMEPTVLLLDEITSALDPELVGEMLDVVAELAEEGRTMLFVSHEMLFVRSIAERVLFLHEGKIEEEGSPDRIFRHPESVALQRFLGRFTKWGSEL